MVSRLLFRVWQCPVQQQTVILKGGTYEEETGNGLDAGSGYDADSLRRSSRIRQLICHSG